MKVKNILYLFVAVLFIPLFVSAHQPRLADNNFIQINNPEISQAFYGELKGSPVEFQIKSDKEFRLYIGLLVPDIPNISKDISAEIYKMNGSNKEGLAILDGSNFNWTSFYEEFAKDNYFWGPEYNADDSVKGVDLKGKLVPAGDYRIKVYSKSNIGRYTLVNGFLEVFPMNEVVSSLSIIPQIKLHFFNESFMRVILSPFAWGTILLVYFISFLTAFILRFVIKKIRNNEVTKLKFKSRLIRFILSILLLAWSVTGTWNLIIIFLAGFFLFEALFSWCGFYEILKKKV